MSDAELPELAEFDRNGAADPVLEGVDPVNAWFLDACEPKWPKTAAEKKGDQEKTENDR